MKGLNISGYTLIMKLAKNGKQFSKLQIQRRLPWYFKEATTWFQADKTAEKIATEISQKGFSIVRRMHDGKTEIAVWGCFKSGEPIPVHVIHSR